MVGKYDPIGKISVRGKAVKIVVDYLDSDRARQALDLGYPRKFFCFIDDLKDVLNGTYLYAKIYKDTLAIERGD